MASNPKHHKKRLAEIPEEGVTAIQTYFSSPIPSSREHGTRNSTKNLSKSCHKYQTKTANSDFNRKTTTYAPLMQLAKPATRRNSSPSAHSICSKPSLTVSVKKRKKKPKKIKPKNCDWDGTTSTQHGKSVKKHGSSDSPSKEIGSGSNLMVYIKKPVTNPVISWKEILKNYNWKDVRTLKEDCHRIEIVFKHCKNKDNASRMNNVQALSKLYLLLSSSRLDRKPQEKVIQYVTRYLCSNRHLLSQLVYIIAEAEDLQTCMCTIKILNQILIKGYTFDEADKSTLRKILGAPPILDTLIESMSCINTRFHGNSQYKDEFLRVHTQILQMIITVCKTKSSRKKLRTASEDTIKLIGKLTGACRKTKDLADNLLEAVKIICIKKDNCNILASKKRFFDGLCTCYYLTHKLLTLPMVLKVMSRSKPALTGMSGNEKVVNLILELICYNGKKSLNKRALLSTLYRITGNEKGLKILSKNESFYKLFHYFLKNEKSTQIHYRLGTIKAFTILNRAANRTILPSTVLHMDLHLPDNVKNCLEEENVSEESEPENDESEEESQEDDDSDEVDPSEAADGSSLKTLSTTISDELLTDMCPFFVEYLLEEGETDTSSILKFDLYEGIMQLTNRKIIENRVHRGVNIDRIAYPDAAMLEPETDQHVFNSSINKLPIESLTNKLKCTKGVREITYNPRVVYDLDLLNQNTRKSVAIPHPSTFYPKKVDNQTQATILTSLRFESRFECGNLRRATQTDNYEYELLLSPDTNTTKGFQWFYFQVSNMVPGISYTFNISNCLKFNSQYNYGMQPLMFSVTEYAFNKIGWKRVGEEIVYYGNNYMDETGTKQYKTLSFSVSFQHNNDYVYLAYHYPYTYTRLMIKLFPFLNYKTNQIYVRMDKLCNTVNSKNEIALLTITAAWNRPDTLGIPLRRRPIIFITARVHPGETNASWIMEGIIKFLLDETDLDAVTAREHFIFKIIPMLNPEGVIYGNNRNGLTGADMNRCWASPSKITCPEIYHAKRLIACAKKELDIPIAAYIDIHGHSRQKYFFFYGCNPKMSWNKEDKRSGNVLETLKMLPEMVYDMNPNIRLSQCKYRITKNRESTGRVVMWREFGVKHSYTLECSYSFASDKQSVNTQILNDIGSSVIAALGKLANKAYTSRKVIPSLSLDYSYISNARPTEKRSAESRFKEGADDAVTPLYVNSRVMEQFL